MLVMLMVGEWWGRRRPEPWRHPSESVASTMNYKSQTISVVVLTHNSAATLEPCLTSAKWADELIVVDLGSTDETLALARRFTDRVFYHPPAPLARLYHDALSLGKSDWLLLLDADEWIEEMLKHEIDGVLLNQNPDVHGYGMARQLQFQNRWVRHGLPAEPARLRMVRRGQWRVGLDWEPQLQVTGRVLTLDRCVGYAPYPDLEAVFTEVNHRSTRAAYHALETRGVTPWGRSLLLALARFKWTLLQGLLFRGGLWGGLTGLSMAMAHAVQVFLTHIKMRALTTPHKG